MWHLARAGLCLGTVRGGGCGSGCSPHHVLPWHLPRPRSLRMLHITKQPEWQRPLVAALQRTLRETALGPWFFSLIATPEAVRSVLRQCYANPAAVTDELVDIILRPGLEPGAAQVFLDFISYSSGPLPEQQLVVRAMCLRAGRVLCPSGTLWGCAPLSVTGRDPQLLALQTCSSS